MKPVPQEFNFPLNKIEQQFANRALKRGGVLLIPKTEAILMVQACLNANACILGIDGFWLHEDGMIQPSLEHSVDYSSQTQQDSYLNPAFRDPLQFLSIQPDQMYFEVVCTDEPCKDVNP